MQRDVVFAEGEFYHLYNRGVDKRKIFLDENDHLRFVRLLYVANSTTSFVFRDIERLPLKDVPRGEPLVAIGAYVLMPNHFHILVKEIRNKGISTFMEKLLTGYAAYFNKRQKRTGALFQGRFQARHADHDAYLKYLFSYIHLNPVKLIQPRWKEVGITNMPRTREFLAKYRYSSYLDLSRNVREQSIILATHEFPDYFSNSRDLNDHIDEWLLYREVYGADPPDQSAHT